MILEFSGVMYRPRYEEERRLLVQVLQECMCFRVLMKTFAVRYATRIGVEWVHPSYLYKVSVVKFATALIRYRTNIDNVTETVSLEDLRAAIYEHLSDKEFNDSYITPPEPESPKGSSDSDEWAVWWILSKSTPRDSFRKFVNTYMLEQLGSNQSYLCCIYTDVPCDVAKYSATTYGKFPYTSWDSLAFSLSLVMTGWHAPGMPQVPNPSYTDKATGGLALAHWRALTTQIPKEWRGNPFAKESPGRFPLQIIEYSAFSKLRPGLC